VKSGVVRDAEELREACDLEYPPHDARRLDRELHAVIVRERMGGDEGTDAVGAEVRHAGQVDDGGALGVDDRLEDRVGEVLDQTVVDVTVDDEARQVGPVLALERPEARAVDLVVGEPARGVRSVLASGRGGPGIHARLFGTRRAEYEVFISGGPPR
jgi:hypothetical protein